MGYEDGDRTPRRKALGSSMVGSVVFECHNFVVNGQSKDLPEGCICNENRAVLKWMLSNAMANAAAIIHASSSIPLKDALIYWNILPMTYVSTFRTVKNIFVESAKPSSLILTS